MQFDGGALLVTAVSAVLAPLISEIPIGLRLPMVVVEVGLAIIVGPHVLGWASPTGMLALLGYLSLIFLFFLAGMELDFDAVRGRPSPSRLRVGYFPWPWLFRWPVFCTGRTLFACPTPGGGGSDYNRNGNADADPPRFAANWARALEPTWLRPEPWENLDRLCCCLF